MGTLIGETYMKFPTIKSKKKVRFGLYKCLYCDNCFEAQTYQVKVGHSTSCGCRVGFQNNNIPANKSKYNTESNLYQKWESMKARCYSKTSKQYQHYGGRNIKICTSWLSDFGAFKSWAEASGFREGLHIHRINNDGDYEPENCIFLSASAHTILHNRNI